MVEQGKRDLVQAMADQLGVNINAIDFMGRLGIKEIKFMMDIMTGNVAEAQKSAEDIQAEVKAAYDEGMQAGKDLMMKTFKKD